MGVRLKLFVMMVLQFFIWGAWLPLIFGYLPGLGFALATVADSQCVSGCCHRWDVFQ